MSNISADTLDDRQLRLWGIPLSVVALLGLQMPFYFPGRWDLLWKYIFISLIYTSLLWEVSRWLLIRIRRKYAAIEQTSKRVWRIAWTFVLVVAIGQLSITCLIVLLGLQAPAWVSFFHTWVANFASSLFFVTLVGGAYEAKYFFSQYKNALQKAEHLKTQQTQQRLDALKNRVNPHFLFNSLTTLSALIGEDPPRAERFVDELSKVYRYLLRAGRQQTALLGEEWQFAESYSFLLKNRFEEGAFSLNFQRPATAETRPDSSPDHDLLLPALSLQNALDYLVRTQNAPLHIQIQPLENQLKIECQYQPKALSFDATYNDWQHLEASHARQEVEADRLTIKIPFIRRSLDEGGFATYSNATI